MHSDNLMWLPRVLKKDLRDPIGHPRQLRRLQGLLPPPPRRQGRLPPI